MSIAQESLRLTGLFEAELLVELMLRYWRHPYADDVGFRQDLLEAAAEVLKASVADQQLLQEIAPQNMSLVAAVWYAESSSLDAAASLSTANNNERREWTEMVRRSVPSCFCDPDLLE